MRTSPNVVITGTPGVGKTVHCEQLAQETGLEHLSINKVAKERECHEGFDRELQSYIVDEDKVRRPALGQGKRKSPTTNQKTRANIVTRCHRGGHAQGRQLGRLARL